MQGYERDPRSLAKRAEAYLKSTGIADGALFGPENEFFIFDSVRCGNDMRGALLRDRLGAGRVELAQGIRGRQQGPPPGHQGRLLPGAAGGCLPGHPLGDVPGVRGDGAQGRGAPPRGGDRRAGRDRHRRRHAGQQGRPGADPQVRAASTSAHGYGKTATFMPKPLVGDNGSGMHVHQSLQKEGRALFAGDKYGGLSDARALLHRRHHQARQGAQRLHQRRHQQLQAPGARASRRR